MTYHSRDHIYSYTHVNKCVLLCYGNYALTKIRSFLINARDCVLIFYIKSSGTELKIL